MNFDEIRDTVETLGWTWYEDEDGVELGQGSPAGEDFHFYVSKSNCKTPYEFIREVRECAENFDTDEHVKEVMGGKWCSVPFSACGRCRCHQEDAFKPC